MRIFTGQRTISDISRQVYTGQKSTFTTTGVTATGYLRPMTEEQASMNNVQYGLGFLLIVEVGTDIRQGDRVTVDGVVYTVRGVAIHDRGTNTSFVRCLLSKGQN